MLHGRRSECDALERLLADARRSRSGVLVVRGEAGVGKSALLDHAAGLADGMAVLRASGVESEAELPVAALHQLLRPVLGLVGRLPAPQAAGLGGALGLGPLGDRESDRDRFLVSVAVLSLLPEAAEDRQVLCVVDEVQWLDRSSAQALTFAARRLEAEGVALLPLTTRLERTFGERVRRLPEQARTILLVAAAETDGDPAVVLRAGARLGVGPDALDQAESAGLVGPAAAASGSGTRWSARPPTMPPPWRPGRTPTGPWPACWPARTPPTSGPGTWPRPPSGPTRPRPPAWSARPTGPAGAAGPPRPPPPWNGWPSSAATTGSGAGGWPPRPTCAARSRPAGASPSRPRPWSPGRSWPPRSTPARPSRCWSRRARSPATAAT